MDYDVGVAPTARTDKLMSRAFGFLIEELGFELTDSHVGQRESSVTFASSQCRVQVHVDHLPLSVSVGVGLFEKKGQRTMVDEHGLVDVVRDRASEEAARLLTEVESTPSSCGAMPETFSVASGPGCRGSDVSGQQRLGARTRRASAPLSGRRRGSLSGRPLRSSSLMS